MPSDITKCLEMAVRTPYGVLADSINQEVKVSKIREQLRDEIPTLNRMGYMKLDFDNYAMDFVNYAASTKGLVVDLGCAYGRVVHKVLEVGGKIVASDLSTEHLLILLQNAPKEYLSNLYIYPGSFPGEVNFPTASIDAVYTSRMFHFLDGNLIEEGLKKIHNWLTPGGKLFFIVVTPHNVAIKDGFLPIYQERVKQGEKWPGVIENQWEINPVHKEYVEPYLHVFDQPELEQVVENNGFRIEKMSLFDYPNDVDSKGKGHIGFIAAKK